jgi:hypothetical protein
MITMPLTPGKYRRIDAVLATEPPTHLFHYTSPAGLLGICESKSIWATNVAFLNDLKETAHAQTVLETVVANRLEAPKYADRYSEQERDLLSRMLNFSREPWPFIYVASLTEERDLLSQWRAYCPPTGGYAIGFPTSQLRVMAVAQGFTLTPCVYDYNMQYKLVGELVDYHLLRTYRDSTGAGAIDLEVSLKNFREELLRLSPILKHSAFVEEREWRLIAFRWSNAPDILFRAQRGAIVPYLKFRIEDEQNKITPRSTGNVDHMLGIVSGPTEDRTRVSFAVRELAWKYFGSSVWHSQSDAPYRGT